MIYRKLDSNGDYSHAAYFRNEFEAVSQAVMTRLRLWEGEWFIDLQEGTPYLDGVMGKYTSDTIDALIKERILNTEGVIEILEYSSSYNPDLRKYTITVKISTIYGDGVVNGVI